MDQERKIPPPQPEFESIVALPDGIKITTGNVNHFACLARLAETTKYRPKSYKDLVGSIQTSLGLNRDQINDVLAQINQQLLQPLGLTIIKHWDRRIPTQTAGDVAGQTSLYLANVSGFTDRARGPGKKFRPQPPQIESPETDQIKPLRSPSQPIQPTASVNEKPIFVLPNKLEITEKPTRKNGLENQDPQIRSKIIDYLTYIAIRNELAKFPVSHSQLTKAFPRIKIRTIQRMQRKRIIRPEMGKVYSNGKAHHPVFSMVEVVMLAYLTDARNRVNFYTGITRRQVRDLERIVREVVADW